MVRGDALILSTAAALPGDGRRMPIADSGARGIDTHRRETEEDDDNAVGLGRALCTCGPVQQCNVFFFPFLFLLSLFLFCFVFYLANN
jgi:hypothetical protein